MRHVIGLAGTAKNTGKTTTLQAVAGLLRAEGLPVYLTSIGYDGEDLDNITGLPKPKISVEEGDQVASALPLLENASARFSGLAFTGVKCALGPVYAATAVSAGKVVLAGPASTQDVAAVLEAAPKGRVVLLDGALSRLAPMSLATAVVLATGAARSQDPAFLAKEMSGIAEVMALPAAGESATTAIRIPGGLFAEGSEKALPVLFAHEVSGARTGPCGPRIRVAIEGPVNPHLLLWVLKSVERLPLRANFVANHAVDLLLSGDHTAWPEVLKKAREDGHGVYVREPAALLGFTLNPYFPRFDQHRGGYTAEVLPGRWFLDAVKSGVNVPCTDIVLEGTKVLESWLRPLLFATASVNV